MKRLFPILAKIAEWGSVISLVGMIGVVGLQVFARFFLPSAPSWTEELARLCFVYAVAFGAGVATREDGLARLDLLSDRLPARAHRGLLLALDICALAFAGTLLVVAWVVARDGWAESSPALGISMSVAFASVALLFASVAIFSLERVLRRIGPRGEPA